MQVVHGGLSFLASMLCPLIAVAFYTLLERKIIGYCQIRRGPNKVSLGGVLQPLADALKLLSKEVLVLRGANLSMFLFFPALALFLSLVLWGFYPNPNYSYSSVVSVIGFLAVSGVSVFCILGSGWASNSKYALMGAVRGVAQSISYEVSGSLILWGASVILGGLEIVGYLYNSGVVVMFLMPPVFILWGITCLAETSRAPFDFAEGESELVSGFNIEYGGVGFTLIFMAEYGNMLFLSLLSAVLFIPCRLVGFSGVLGVSCMLAVCYLWVRASLPRLRYDQLMYFCWKGVLPVILIELFFFISLVVYVGWLY